jgi:hypothetical protein
VDNSPDEAPVKAPHLTKRVRGELIKFIQGGLPIEVAARLVGTTDSTVRIWRLRSRQGANGNLHGFDDEVQRALAFGESVLLARIQTAGTSNWRAAAWLLERTHPDRWGPPAAPSLFPDVPPAVADAQDDLAGL